MYFTSSPWAPFNQLHTHVLGKGVTIRASDSSHLITAEGLQHLRGKRSRHQQPKLAMCHLPGARRAVLGTPDTASLPSRLGSGLRADAPRRHGKTQPGGLCPHPRVAGVTSSLKKTPLGSNRNELFDDPLWTRRERSNRSSGELVVKQTGETVLVTLPFHGTARPTSASRHLQRRRGRNHGVQDAKPGNAATRHCRLEDGRRSR